MIITRESENKSERDSYNGCNNSPIDTVIAEIDGCGLGTLSTLPVHTLRHFSFTLHTLQGKKRKKAHLHNKSAGSNCQRSL